jgi:hypothetical protein
MSTTKPWGGYCPHAQTNHTISILVGSIIVQSSNSGYVLLDYYVDISHVQKANRN